MPHPSLTRLPSRLTTRAGSSSEQEKAARPIEMFDKDFTMRQLRLARYGRLSLKEKTKKDSARVRRDLKTAVYRHPEQTVVRKNPGRKKGFSKQVITPHEYGNDIAAKKLNHEAVRVGPRAGAVLVGLVVVGKMGLLGMATEAPGELMSKIRGGEHAASAADSNVEDNDNGTSGVVLGEGDAGSKKAEKTKAPETTANRINFGSLVCKGKVVTVEITKDDLVGTGANRNYSQLAAIQRTTEDPVAKVFARTYTSKDAEAYWADVQKFNNRSVPAELGETFIVRDNCKGFKG